MGSKLPQEILICGAAPPALPWQAWVDLLSWPHCSTQTRLQVPEPLAGSEGRFGCGGPPLPSSTVQATEARASEEARASTASLLPFAHPHLSRGLAQPGGVGSLRLL